MSDLESDSRRLHFGFDVRCDADELWVRVGDWNDVSWVMGATGTEVLPDGTRRVDFGEQSLVERIVDRSDSNRALTYEIVRSAMPVSAYRGTVALTPLTDGSTHVTYDNVFRPIEGAPPEQVVSALKTAFEARFAWIQKKFGSR